MTICPHCGEEFSSRFKKPTIEEIAAYCLERGNNIDPELFFETYETKDWMVGSSRMKNWKSAVRKWERTSINGNAKAIPKTSTARTQLRTKSNVETMAERRRQDEEARRKAAQVPTVAELLSKKQNGHPEFDASAKETLF